MRVLHALHDFLPRHPAGSEIYVAALASAQRRLGLDPHVLASEYDPSRPHATLAWRCHDGVPVTEIVNNWEVTGFEDTWRPTAVGEQLEAVLDALEPDVLHVHNLLDLSFDLPRLARARGIPVVATLHDWTLVCPSGGQRFHAAEEWVCRDIDPERCARCFRESPFGARIAWTRVRGKTAAAPLARALGGLLRGAPRLLGLGRRLAVRAVPAVTPADIERRLAAARDVMAAIERFVAPSRALASGFAALGAPPERLEVSDYGFPPLSRPARPLRAGRPLVFGFVGTLVRHKGPHVLIAAARRLPGLPFEVVLHGDLRTFPDYGAELERLAAGFPVRFAGPFGRDRAGEVYAGMDVLVVPSLWPENSPLVLHEAFQAGVPAIGAATGGIPDLIADGRTGLLVPPGSAEALAAAMRRCVEEPGLVERLATGLPAVKDIDADAREWVERYRAALAR